MMKFSFGQIYPEVGARFSLPGTLLTLLRSRLDELQKEIKHFKNKFPEDDFSIVFIISATRKKDRVEAKGPTYLHKRREIEFAVHIPYKEMPEFDEKISYVLNQIAEGIISVLNKYKTDSSGIKEVIQDVVRIVQQNPDKYCFDR